MTIFRGASWVS